MAHSFLTLMIHWKCHIYLVTSQFSTAGDTDFLCELTVPSASLCFRTCLEFVISAQCFLTSTGLQACWRQELKSLSTICPQSLRDQELSSWFMTAHTIELYHDLRTFLLIQWVIYCCYLKILFKKSKAVSIYFPCPLKISGMLWEGSKNSDVSPNTSRLG